MESLIKTLEEMKKSVQSMSTENSFQYTDGWKDGIEYVVDKLEKMLEQETVN